MLNCF